MAANGATNNMTLKRPRIIPPVLRAGPLPFVPAAAGRACLGAEPDKNAGDRTAQRIPAGSFIESLAISRSDLWNRIRSQKRRRACGRQSSFQAEKHGLGSNRLGRWLHHDECPRGRLGEKRPRQSERPRKRQPSVFDAKLIGIDRLLDLALLKIGSNGLTPLSFGNSLGLKQGELVLAFGSPLGMDNSVSMGVVSAVARQLTENDPRIFVQTDAPINPGNSGGPLVDADGRLVGINTFILSQSGGSEGIGFAIPSNVVQYVYGSLRKDGHVHRGQIGILARTITEPLASAFKLEPEKGVLVEDVVPEGPADKAGIQVGDVVLSIQGTGLRSIRDLALQLYQYSIGDTVTLEILRNENSLLSP